LKINDDFVTDPELTTSHAVNHFTSIFTSSNNVHNNGLIEEVIPNLLTMMPSREEIKSAVFSMN